MAESSRMAAHRLHNKLGCKRAAYTGCEFNRAAFQHLTRGTTPNSRVRRRIGESPGFGCSRTGLSQGGLRRCGTPWGSNATQLGVATTPWETIGRRRETSGNFSVHLAAIPWKGRLCDVGRGDRSAHCPPTPDSRCQRDRHSCASHH